MVISVVASAAPGAEALGMSTSRVGTGTATGLDTGGTEDGICNGSVSMVSVLISATGAPASAILTVLVVALDTGVTEPQSRRQPGKLQRLLEQA